MPPRIAYRACELLSLLSECMWMVRNVSGPSQARYSMLVGAVRCSGMSLLQPVLAPDVSGV
jgi:hypothetical protein